MRYKLKQPESLRILLVSIKGIPGRYKVLPGKTLIRLLIPAVVIAFVATSLVVLLSYTPGTAAAFPYIPPPTGGTVGYLASTVRDITKSLIGRHIPLAPEDFEGQSFILKNILITTKGLTTKKVAYYDQRGELLKNETKTYLVAGLIQFIPQEVDKWQQLKAGDVVDIIGVCAGVSHEYGTMIVFEDCRFLPAGVAPLPLPGGVVITGGY